MVPWLCLSSIMKEYERNFDQPDQLLSQIFSWHPNISFFSATGCKKLNTITRLQIILSISRSFVRSETRPDLTRKQSGRTKKIPSERTKSRIQQNNLFNCFTLLGALPWTPDKTFDIFLTYFWQVGMSDVWQVANHSGENLVIRRRRTTSSSRRYEREKIQ